jgi:chromosome segregation ATPase
MRSLILFCLLPFVVGCQDKAAQQQMQTTLTHLTERNRALENRLDSMTTELKKKDEEAALFEKKWQDFQQAFLPEQRQTLEKNAQAAEKLLTDLKAAQESLRQEIEKARQTMTAETKTTKEACDEALVSLRSNVEETAKLKDECLKHAKQANDADLVRTLKASMTKMEQSVMHLAGLDGQVSSALSTARQAKADAMSAKSEATLARSDARNALSTAQRALSRIR